MSDLKEKTSFEWFNIEESKLGFNFGSLTNKLFTEVGIYAEIGVFTNTIYKYNSTPDHIIGGAAFYKCN